LPQNLCSFLLLTDILIKAQVLITDEDGKTLPTTDAFVLPVNSSALSLFECKSIFIISVQSLLTLGYIILTNVREIIQLLAN